MKNNTKDIENHNQESIITILEILDDTIKGLKSLDKRLATIEHTFNMHEKHLHKEK